MKDVLRNEIKIGDWVAYPSIEDGQLVLEVSSVFNFDYDCEGKVIALVGVAGNSLNFYGHQLLLVKGY